VGPLPAVADLIFPGKNWRPFLVITVCQFCGSAMSPHLFSPEKLSTFFVHHCLFYSFHSFTRVLPIISGMLLCCKKFAAPLVGATFCGAAVRPNTAEHA